MNEVALNTVVCAQCQREATQLIPDRPPDGWAVQAGKRTLCPDCLARAQVPCEGYSRIVGYLRPIQNWNAAKQQEFADRVVFNTK